DHNDIATCHGRLLQWLSATPVKLGQQCHRSNSPVSLGQREFDGAYEAFRAKIALHARVGEAVRYQLTAKTGLGRSRDGWTVLLSPYPTQSMSILAPDDLPHDFDGPAGSAERAILGGIGRELVHKQTEGRSRLARQHCRGTFHADPLRIRGKVGLEL